MIPPISPDVLLSNQQFASLHKTLTTKYLDQDASTKSVNTSHQPVNEQSLKQLTEKTKENILTQALRDVALWKGQDDLPDELRELVYIISTYMITVPTLTSSQQELLSSEIERLNGILPSISNLLSQELQSQHTHLYALAKTSITEDPDRDTLFRYSFQVHLKDTLTQLATLQQTTIPAATITLINTLSTLLSLQTQYLTLQLTHLSRYTHGTLSRHTLSKSSHLSIISQALASKIRLLGLEARRSTYSAQTQSALANYATHLDELTRGLDSRIRTLEDELRLYADCDARGGKTMEELGRRYGDVLREIEEVKGDVERLGDEEKASNGDRKVSRTTYEIP
jgi:hypothetical protein